MEMTAPLSLSHPQPGGGGGGGKSASGAESDGGGKSKRRPFAGESHTDTETELDGGAGGRTAKLNANAAAAERMRTHIIELEAKVKSAEEDRALAESAVTARDREVKRLGQLLEQGRDIDALHAEHAHQTNQKIIEQLNLQVGEEEEEALRGAGRDGPSRSHSPCATLVLLMTPTSTLHPYLAPHLSPLAPRPSPPSPRRSTTSTTSWRPTSPSRAR